MANPSDGSQTADSQGEGQQPGQETVSIDDSYGLVPYLVPRIIVPSNLVIGQRFSPRFLITLEDGVIFEDPSGIISDLLIRTNGGSQYFTLFAKLLGVSSKSTVQFRPEIRPYRFHIRDVSNVFAGINCELDTLSQVPLHFETPGQYEVYCRFRRNDDDTLFEGWENLEPNARITVGLPKSSIVLH